MEIAKQLDGLGPRKQIPRHRSRCNISIRSSKDDGHRHIPNKFGQQLLCYHVVPLHQRSNASFDWSGSYPQNELIQRGCLIDQMLFTYLGCVRLSQTWVKPGDVFTPASSHGRGAIHGGCRQSAHNSHPRPRWDEPHYPGPPCESPSAWKEWMLPFTEGVQLLCHQLQILETEEERKKERRTKRRR